VVIGKVPLSFEYEYQIKCLGQAYRVKYTGESYTLNIKASTPPIKKSIKSPKNSIFTFKLMCLDSVISCDT
jgi:hypothetical protein